MYINIYIRVYANWVCCCVTNRYVTGFAVVYIYADRVCGCILHIQVYADSFLVVYGANQISKDPVLI